MGFSARWLNSPDPFLVQPKNNQSKESMMMNRINRREFLSVLGGATAISMAIPAFASTTTADQTVTDVTSLYVKGLVMVDLGNPEVIRLGFPKAPGHRATLSVVPENGARQVLAIKG